MFTFAGWTTSNHTADRTSSQARAEFTVTAPEVDPCTRKNDEAKDEEGGEPEKNKIINRACNQHKEMDVSISKHETKLALAASIVAITAALDNYGCCLEQADALGPQGLGIQVPHRVREFKWPGIRRSSCSKSLGIQMLAPCARLVEKVGGASKAGEKRRRQARQGYGEG